MANELSLQVSMNVRKADAYARLLLNSNLSHSFKADIAGNKGPLPGSVQVPLAGVAISLSQLTQPGWCWLKHQGLASGADPGTTPSIYYIEVGIKDVLSGRFLPLIEMQPGWEFPIYITRNLLEAYNSTGTGTGPANNSLWAIAHIAACNLYVGAFEA